MQRCLKLLALARCSGFLLPRARITPPQLQESAGDDFLLDLFREPTSASSTTPRTGRRGIMMQRLTRSTTMQEPKTTTVVV